MVPIVIPVAVAAGVDPFVPALAATFAASFGFMLPVSTPQNAIVYGSGVVPITQMVRNGFFFDVDRSDPDRRSASRSWSARSGSGPRRARRPRGRGSRTSGAIDSQARA